jgi:3-dehydroquinate dehydratase-1
MTKICIPIKTSSLEDLYNKIKESYINCDLIEIWIGELFVENSLENLKYILDKIFEWKKEFNNIPLLFNVKTEKEKGNFNGTKEQKKEIFIELINRNAEYIDIDYLFDNNFFNYLKEHKKNTEIILSAHFFEGTPSFPSLKNRVQIMKNNHADIIKIASFPETKKDLISIFRLMENLDRNNIPFILISMGEEGKISRVMNCLFNGKMMFATLNSDNKSATGQLNIKDLKTCLNILK